MKENEMKLLNNWLLKRRIYQAIKLLARIDETTKTCHYKFAKMPRWKRKQIWRDFIKSDPGKRNITNLLNGAKQ